MSTKTTTSLEDMLDFMDDDYSPENDNDDVDFDNNDDSDDDDDQDDPEDRDDDQDEPEPQPAKTKSEPKSEPTKTDEDDEEGGSVYKQHFEILKESGLVFDDETEFDGSAESLADIIEQTKEEIWDRTAQALWGALPDDFKPLLEYALSGGNDITQFLEAVRPKAELDQLSIDTAEGQKEILTRYYERTTNYTPDKIRKLVEKTALTDTLYEDAVEAYEELKEISEADLKQLAIQEQKARQEAEKREEQMRKIYAETIDKVDFIPKDRKNKVKAYLFNVQVYEDEPDTQFNRTLKLISANPEHLVQLADVLMSYDPKKGITLDRVAKVESTKATKTLKEKLQAITQPTKNLGMGSTMRSSSGEKFDWDEFLKQN
jgi:hypothetical protein